MVTARIFNLKNVTGWLQKRSTPATLFLIIAAFFAVLWAVITPPFQAPDETWHFCRAWQLADGHLFALTMNNTAGDSLPVSVIETMTQISPGLRFHSKENQDVAKIWHYLRLPLQKEVRAFYAFPSSAIYPPTAYLPAVAAIAAGKMVNLSPLLTMYLGRFACMFLWLGLVYGALRITPSGRWVMALIALMPMSIFLAGAVHQDGFINGFCFLLLAYTLRLSSAPGKLTWRQFAALALIILLLAFSKPGFALIALVYLLLPGRKFASWRIYYGSWALIAAAAMLVTWIWKSLAQQDLSWLQPWASYEDQLRAVMTNPLLFISAALRSFWLYKFFYIRSHIGQLGWLDTLLPMHVVLTFLLLLLVAALLNDEGSISKTQRWLMALIALAIAGFTALALYLVNSPVGGPYIHGISGRYFIPAAPFFWLLWQNGKIRKRLNASPLWILAGAAVVVACLVSTTLALYGRYYL